MKASQKIQQLKDQSNVVAFMRPHNNKLLNSTGIVTPVKRCRTATF